MVTAPVLLLQRTVAISVVNGGGVLATVATTTRQISVPIQTGPVDGGGHNPVLSWVGDQIAIDGVISGPHLTGPRGIQGQTGTDGADGHSPVLSWVGDQIAIDGVVSGPHLTGPAGEAGGDTSSLKSFAVAMAVAMG